jgi:hypothetical protein
MPPDTRWVVSSRHLCLRVASDRVVTGTIRAANVDDARNVNGAGHMLEKVSTSLPDVVEAVLA